MQHQVDFESAECIQAQNGRPRFGDDKIDIGTHVSNRTIAWN